jgi:hypothetical protein
MRVYLLVFDDGSDPNIDLQGYLESLDEGAEIHALDGHVCFVKTSLSVTELSNRFLQFAGSSLFFVTEVNSSDCAGRMIGKFWEFLDRPAFQTAAE